MRIGIAMCVVIGLLPCADTAKGDDSLQGTWKLVAGEADGKPLSEQQLRGGKLVIKGDRYSVKLAGSATITGVQKLASTPNARTIDIKDDNGTHKGEMSLGIYELKGDEFRIALAPPGKARPSSFSTKAGSGYWIHVWKRVKK